MTNSFIGANRKIALLLLLQFCFPFSSFRTLPLSQAIALLNNRNNKCSDMRFSKSGYFNATKCLRENYLLFRSIFLWWCVFFFHARLYIWCTHPVKRNFFHIHTYNIDGIWNHSKISCKICIETIQPSCKNSVLGFSFFPLWRRRSLNEQAS